MGMGSTMGRGSTMAMGFFHGYSVTNTRISLFCIMAKSKTLEKPGKR